MPAISEQGHRTIYRTRYHFDGHGDDCDNKHIPSAFDILLVNGGEIVLVNIFFGNVIHKKVV